MLPKVTSPSNAQIKDTELWGGLGTRPRLHNPPRSDSAAQSVCVRVYTGFVPVNRLTIVRYISVL